MTLSRTIANKAQETRGAAKKFLGRATGNTRLHTEGRIDQAKGSAKQSGERFKDVFRR